MNFLGTIVRFVVSAIVLLIVGFLVPGFAVLSFGSAILAAVVIAALGWAIERFFGREVSPYGRGISGFISAAIVIYIAQWFIPGMRVTILGALLASIVIGIVDLFIPGRVIRGGDRAEHH